jgi:hypothetical protein
MDKKRLTSKLAACALVAAFSSTAHSAYVVDGIVGAGEYASGTTLDLGFADEQNRTANPIAGSFSYVVDGSYIYAALSAPTDFVDNVYGAPSLVDGSGWLKGSSGKKREHTFKHLLKSDDLEFELNTINGKKTVNFDYLEKSGSGYAAEIVSDGGGIILDLATSLEYNLSHGCGDTSNSGPFVGNCTPSLTYEWKMDATKFASFSVADLLNPTMHASPSKVDDQNFTPDCMQNGTFANCNPTNPPVNVSEPGTLALLFAGLAGLGFARRKK